MENQTFNHYSVLFNECIEGLNIKENGVYVDCTAGGGGHSYGIASKLKNGKLIAIDRDIDAIHATEKRLSGLNCSLETVHSNFDLIGDILKENKIDGALIDLGVSSHQLDTPDRGFSYMHDAPLDMRMDRGESKGAYEVINNYSYDELCRIFYEYGEEKFSKKIAENIVSSRTIKPISTTFELVDIIKKSIPAKFLNIGGHPAKRVFQAVRIEVNNELGVIAPTLESLVHHLNPGGRLAVITFHSLEDRIVKQTFTKLSSGCTCPPDFPVCVCGKKPIIKLVNKKPILPSSDELEHNSRSHSAKLRIAEKI